MTDKRQVGVRYCGGCNPRYDRVALVRQLNGFFPGEAFLPAQPGAAYSAMLVVCGCPARCADVSGLTADRLYYLTAAEDLLPTREKLSRILPEPEE